MSSARKQNEVSRAWLLATMGLAAGAGYWWGAARDQALADANRGAIQPSWRRERSAEARVSSPTSGTFLRNALKGVIDERQHWRQVRGFSEAEVKAAINDLEKLDRYFIASPDLQAMLFYRWAEIDPVAANTAAVNAAAKSPFPQGFSRCRQAVIAAWINQGGAVAAWNAVRDENKVWACTRSVPGEVSTMIAASLVDQDDASAFKEVIRMNDENCLLAEDLCIARARRAAGSPESRAAFIAAAASHPEPYVMNCAIEELFKEWAKTDVAAARAGLPALSLDTESLDSVNRVIDTVEREQARDAEGEAP